MAISQEMILKPTDISRVSVQRKSCDMQVELDMWRDYGYDSLTADPSQKKQAIPEKCSSCNDTGGH